MGGLGNQLHQLCFAKYLEKNNFETFINTQWFENLKVDDSTTQRKLSLNIEKFNLNTVHKKQMYRYHFYEKIEKFPLVKRVYISRFNNYYKSHFGNSFNTEISYLKNRFIGYWQNPKFYGEKKQYLMNSLDKHEEFISRKSEQKSESTLIHIRNGDYIDWNEDLPSQYYNKAVNQILKIEKKAKFDIFTDSQNTENYLFKYAENVYNDIDENPLSTLSRMTNYKNFIIANSSLSFFAAFLGSDHQSKVIYPNPWFKDLNHIYYEKENWISLNYRKN